MCSSSREGREQDSRPFYAAEERGVLRQAVPHWLGRPDLAQWLSATRGAGASAAKARLCALGREALIAAPALDGGEGSGRFRRQV